MRGDLFMIADGMGGAAAGEVASAMCAEAFAEIDLIRTRGDDALRAGDHAPPTQRIHERAPSDPTAAGMGTTVTAALVEADGRIALANVGDSRAYLLRDGEPAAADARTTRWWPSWWQAARSLRQEAEQPSAAKRGHTGAGSRARRCRSTPSGWTPSDGDVVLLCSDGLTDMVAEEEFAKILAGDADCDQVARDAGAGGAGRRAARTT